MKAVMKTMIVLSLLLFLLGQTEGCKEKNEEEEDAAKIVGKLEKLEEKAKKITREVSVKLGQPFTFWQRIDSGFSGDMTQFSMTFENVAVTDEDMAGRKEEKNKCFMILARVMNQGPRKSWRSPSNEDIQVKTDKGYLYRTSDYPALAFFPTEPPFPLDWRTNWKYKSKESLEPEEIGWIIYWTFIPEDNTPVEVFAQFPTEESPHDGEKRTSFLLKLTQAKKETPLSKKIPEARLPSKYTTPGLEEKEKLGQQINTKLKTYANKDSFPLPPISLALRTTAPDLVEKVETIYFTALDYQFYSLRSLRFARDFLNEGEVAKSKKYIEKAERHYNFATSLQRDSFSVLDSTYSAAQWMVVYKASRTALGFTATGLGIGASTLFDLGTLYTDYSLDTSTTSIEEAKKNLIANAISNVLLRFTGTSDLVGDAVKQGWGSSRAFPVLQKIMGSSEFKDAVLGEFMRLGGDVGDYVAKKAIEDALEKVLRGSMEVGGEKAEPSAPQRMQRHKRVQDVGEEKAEPCAPSSVRSEPVQF